MEPWIQNFAPSAAAIAAAVFLLKRWFKQNDESLKQINETLKGVVGQDICKERREGLKEDVETLCKKNRDEHDELWKHRHGPTGDAYIPHV